MKNGSKKVVITSLLANITIASSKFVGFLITGSGSMLAETVHSVADTGNQVILLFGSSRSKRKASKTHQFGYGAERYFYSFIVALAIFLIGGLFATFEGVMKLREEYEIQHASVAIVILAIALVVESYALKTAVNESNKTRLKMSWNKFVKSSKNPELPVLLLEDSAAVIGLFFAFMGVTLTLITGNSIFDAVATLLIGLLLIVVAVFLGKEMKSLLIGEAALPVEENEIIQLVQSVSGVEKIIHLRTLHLSPDEILLAIKIGVNPALSMSQLSSLINLIERSVREKNEKIKLIYIEPDIYQQV